MASRLIAKSVQRTGVAVTNLPFFKALPREHRDVFVACEDEFEHVFIGGDYCQFLAQREKAFRSYC